MTKARAIMRLYSRLLAWLLHYANARPPLFSTDFYSLKTRLLHRFAERCGYDVQEIRKECWGDRRDAFRDVSGCGPKCTRCGGTGVYDLFWVRLERWQWGRYTFHCPVWRDRIRPLGPINIHGRIQHAKYGRASDEAVLWLYLLCGEWRLLWYSIKSSCSCGWYFWPLLNLQRVVMSSRAWFHRRRQVTHRLRNWITCPECGRHCGTHGPDELHLPF
jgi:hypothetical protein